jgi:hypothetical protein
MVLSLVKEECKIIWDSNEAVVDNSYQLSYGDYTVRFAINNELDNKLAVQLWNWTTMRQIYWYEWGTPLNPDVPCTECSFVHTGTFKLTEDGEYKFVLYNKDELNNWTQADSCGTINIVVTDIPPTNPEFEPEIDSAKCYLYYYEDSAKIYVAFADDYTGEGVIPEGKKLYLGGTIVNTGAAGDCNIITYDSTNDKWISADEKTLDENEEWKFDILQGILESDTTLEVYLTNNEGTNTDSASFSLTKPPEFYVDAKITNISPSKAIEGDDVKVSIDVKTVNSNSNACIKCYSEVVETKDVIVNNEESYNILPDSTITFNGSFTMPSSDVNIYTIIEVSVYKDGVCQEYKKSDEKTVLIELSEPTTTCIDTGDGNDFIEIEVVGKSNFDLTKITAVELFRCNIPIGCPYNPYGWLSWLGLDSVEYGYELIATGDIDENKKCCFYVNKEWDYAIAVKADGNIVGQRLFTTDNDFNKTVQISVKEEFPWLLVGGLAATLFLVYSISRKPLVVVER